MDRYREVFKEKRVGCQESKKNDAEYMGVCEEECMSRSPGDEPLTLTRCHS